MNKTDLLAEKLPHSPLGGYILDYQGRDNYDSACVYYLLYLFACRAEQIFCICVRYAVDYLYVCESYFGLILGACLHLCRFN